MVTFVTVIYVIVCIFLILVVLLQAGRGGGMGAAMGGSSQTVFGGAGASNFLQRLTVISASLFMLLSAVLAYMSSTGEQSLERAAERLRAREEALQDPGSEGVAPAAAADAGQSTPAGPTGDGLLEDEALTPALQLGTGDETTTEGLLEGESLTPPALQLGADDAPAPSEPQE